MKFIKYFIFLLLAIPVAVIAQPSGSWPVSYGSSAPSYTPSSSGTRLYFNTATNELYTWQPSPTSSWIKYPKAFDQISGCSAPGYTPTARQSVFAVNSCTALQNGRGPELYQYTGSQWVCLNCYTNYTAGTGIGISSGVITNAAPDQVVGLTGGGITVVTGTYPNFTITSNEVDGSASNELNTSLSVAGGNLRLTDPGGNLDVPVSSIAPVQAVSDGTGISISGTTTRTITNTGDLSATNEIQTLSLSGSDLSLSLGGGTVTLPGDGNGIYSGSGVVPPGTIATAGDISLELPGNNFVAKYSVGTIENYIGVNNKDVRIVAGNSEKSTSMILKPGAAEYTATDAPFVFYATGLSGGIDFVTPEISLVIRNEYVIGSGEAKMVMTDARTNRKGIEYASEYPDIANNPTSVPYVKMFADGLIPYAPVSYTNAAAPNNTIFYSTTDSKLSYKDPGGTVHSLY